MFCARALAHIHAQGWSCSLHCTALRCLAFNACLPPCAAPSPHPQVDRNCAALRALFKAADFDRDGAIAFDEFAAAIRFAAPDAPVSIRCHRCCYSYDAAEPAIVARPLRGAWRVAPPFLCHPAHPLPAPSPPAAGLATECRAALRALAHMHTGTPRSWSRSMPAACLHLPTW